MALSLKGLIQKRKPHHLCCTRIKAATGTIVKNQLKPIIKANNLRTTLTTQCNSLEKIEITSYV